MGCCENKDDKDVDVDTDRCCQVGGNGRRCICLPYDDWTIITAQVLSILANLISWVWWVSFIISAIALILLQLVWCCRQSKAGLIAAQVVSTIAGLVNVFAGIYLLVYLKDANWCESFTLIHDDDDGYYSSRYYSCPEKAYAIVAFIDAALWFAAAACTIAFVATGRHAKWEQTLSSSSSSSSKPTVSNNSGAGAVEMAEVPDDSAVVAVPVSEPAADEYVPPQIVKVEEV